MTNNSCSVLSGDIAAPAVRATGSLPGSACQKVSLRQAALPRGPVHELLRLQQ